jgi:hypothetical protein
MSDSVRSMVFGPSVLYVVALAALIMTVARTVRDRSERARADVIRLYLIGIACQCIHFTEEYVTGFYLRAPRFLGFVEWSGEFFVVFNLLWIALWVVSIVGIQANRRIAYFPLWFFTIAMIGNAVWHPLLTLATGGYFPGLITSPFGGIVGALLLRRFAEAHLER